MSKTRTLPEALIDESRGDPGSPGESKVVSLIIPVHNRVELTRACLDSVFANTEPSARLEIMIVDDCSTDATASYLTSLGDKVLVIRNEARGSFGANTNKAAEAASGEYLLILNNDTIVTNNWLKPLLKIAETHKDAAVVGNCQLYASSGLINHAGMVFNDRGRPVHLYDGMPADFPAARTSRTLQAVTGACWLVPRKIFHELGGFDPMFRNGYEDVDFCLRAQKHGYTIWYAADSVIYHHVSSSAGRHDHEEKNATLFAARWQRDVIRDRAIILARDGQPPEPIDGRLHHLFRAVVLRSNGLKRLWSGFLRMPGGLALAELVSRFFRQRP
jgi:O-antigen biosynthesis protein